MVNLLHHLSHSHSTAMFVGGKPVWDHVSITSVPPPLSSSIDISDKGSCAFGIGHFEFGENGGTSSENQ